jgi:hypothetical protein
MIGRNQSDIYVAACGEVFATRDSGICHEQYCAICTTHIRTVTHETSDTDYLSDNQRQDADHD